MSALPSNLIDDFTHPHHVASIGTSWQFLTDGVMGGVSSGAMQREEVAGRNALVLRGHVSLENNGGFIQLALDLAQGGGILDASDWRGIEVDVFGAEETYGLHLRTSDLARPWQSYRQSFETMPRWQTLQFHFTGFSPYRTDAAFDPRKPRRMGLIAIGRAFTAGLAVGGVRYFR
jgi:hypothetical protein